MAKVTIQATDVISTSRTDINSNFTELYDNKIETSYLDTDTTLAANSDSKIATQKAVKTYVDASVNPTGRSWNEYAADAGSTDSYAITVSGVSTYVTGQTFKFKANTANTGACTLNVSALGAKTIKKDVTTDLATGDILANQIITVIYDGTNMQLIATPPPSIPVVRTYLNAGSPATWTKPTGLKYVIVEVQGGGGGGGGVGSDDQASFGGGGGGYSRELITAASLGTTETVTTGAGGAGGSGSNAGSTGGTSSFGSHCQATGGTGGDDESISQIGVGGVGSGGDVNIEGGDGDTGVSGTGGSGTSAKGGMGGSSHLGGGGNGATAGNTGGAGNVYGGGGGGTGRTTAGSSAGGAGAAGIVIVTEYY